MKFEFYHSGLESVPKLSVDGTVPSSLHFSHWKGNQTPRELKADTSTEICLNLVSHPDWLRFTQGIELITNNHFDADGLLSVWVTLTGPSALQHRDLLIATAEAGDFSEYSTDEAVRLCILLQGGDQVILDEPTLSPLAQHLAGKPVPDEAEAYAVLLPELGSVLNRVNDYEFLWGPAWRRIAAALESFAKGRSTVVEDQMARISLIVLDPHLYNDHLFHPASDVIPSSAISRVATGDLFVIAVPFENGWSYQVDYPYYSWAETVVRRAVPRRALNDSVTRLQQAESAPSGDWKQDDSGLSSALKFTDAQGRPQPSRLTPDEVASILKQAGRKHPAQ